jgi:hypothetical protein
MPAYYKVEATLNSQAVQVGLPSPQSVRVTLPLVGPAGEKGDKGDKGDPGDQGPQGVPGTGLEVLTTQGDILYQGASVGERLPIGAEGEVLKVESGVPAWGEAGEAYDQSLNTTDSVEFAQVTTEVFSSTDQFDVGGETGISFSNEDGAINTRSNLGLGTAATSDAGDFAAASHGHVASDISDFSTAAAAAAPVQSVAGRTGTVTLAKADVGLGNVDNTSDTNKPISSATQSALDGKAATSHTHPSSAITDFNTAAAAAAPVQSVNGNTGTVTVAVPDLASPPAIGNTTPAAGSFTTLAANNGTLTASAPALDVAQTWNASGTTFTGIRANFTNTASAAASRLMDLQIGGGSHFLVGIDGKITVRGNTNATMLEPSFNFVGCDVTGGGGSGAGRLRFYGTGVGGDFNGVVSVFATALRFMNGAATTQASTNGTDLLADADAHVLAQRRGTNAQTFRLYNTFTNATNFERLNLRWASNEFILDAEAGGTGTLRGIKIGSASTSLLGFFGATPVVQQAAVADATDAASTQDRLNDLLARLRTLGLIAT